MKTPTMNYIIELKSESIAEDPVYLRALSIKFSLMTTIM